MVLEDPQPTVAAIVPTYNRRELLCRCLAALQEQTYPLTAIVVIDNGSTDGTVESLVSAQYLREQPPGNLEGTWETSAKRMDPGRQVEFVYVRNTDNKGGSGAFAQGVRRCCDLGFDWVWLLDDDSRPEPDALRTLMNNPEVHQVGVAASRVINRNRDHEGRIHDSIRKYDRVFRGIRHPPELSPRVFNYVFLGLLVHSRKVRECGSIRGDFFFQADDLEWTLRLSRREGIVYVKESVLIHEDQVKALRMKIFGRTIYYVHTTDVWKDCYNLRNSIIVYRLNSKNPLRYAVGALLQRLIKGFLFHRFQAAFSLYFRAFRDGILVRTDNHYHR